MTFCEVENAISKIISLLRQKQRIFFYYFAKTVCNNAENTKKYNVIDFLRFGMIAENVGIECPNAIDQRVIAHLRKTKHSVRMHARQVS